jgi:hypothetical protein
MSKSGSPKDKFSLSERLQAARDAVGRNAQIGLSKARAGAEVAAEQIAKGKDALDDKTRELLDSAYEAQRAEAVTNLARLRKKYPAASPSEILGHLEKDLAAVEKKAEVDSDIVISSAALYVLTAIEIHGKTVADESARQRLIDAIVVVNSKTTKFVAMFGGAALAMVAAGAGKLGKIAGTVAKAGAKLAWLAPLIAVAGIKNPGKKSVAWVVKTVSSRVLGEPPTQWPATKTSPAASKSAPAKAPAKPAAKPAAKPVAKKPAATKPAAKRAPKTAT